MPAASSVIDTILGNSTTDLAASATIIDYTASGGFNSGVYFDFDSGDLRILAAGIYGIYWYSRAWSLSPNVTSIAEIFADVVSGSNGEWSPQAAGQAAGTAFAGIPLRIMDAGAVIDAQLAMQPDMAVYAGWASFDTFPAVIRTTYTFRVDEVDTATANPAFGVMVVRFGAGFE